MYLGGVHDIAIVKPGMRDFWNLAGIFGRVVARNPFRFCNTCKISRTAESLRVESSRMQSDILGGGPVKSEAG